MNCLLEVVLMEINKLENNNTGHPDAKNGLHLTGPSSSSALVRFYKFLFIYPFSHLSMDCFLWKGSSVTTIEAALW